MAIEADFSLPEDPKDFAAWLERQRDAVKRAARMFPIGSTPVVPIRVYVIGYSGDGEAVVITKNPASMGMEELALEAQHALLLDPDQFKDGGPIVTHEPWGRH